MLALSPPVLPTFGWPSEEHNQISCFSSETQHNSFLQSHELLQEVDHNSTSFTARNSGRDPNMVKKLSHNASERDRRKKMNTLYFSLRSLLPDADQMKRLSIPATISRVLKYIPELEQQQERLVQRKENLLQKLSKQDHIINSQIDQRKCSFNNTLSIVSANQLGEREVAIQISTYNNTFQISPLSEILLFLEEEGLLLIDSSSFQSFDGRVFYNLHLQADRAFRFECDALSERLSSWYDKRCGLLP